MQTPTSEQLKEIYDQWAASFETEALHRSALYQAVWDVAWHTGYQVVFSIRGTQANYDNISVGKRNFTGREGEKKLIAWAKELKTNGGTPPPDADTDSNTKVVGTRLDDAAFGAKPHVDDCNCVVERDDQRCVEYRALLDSETENNGRL